MSTIEQKIYSFTELSEAVKIFLNEVKVGDIVSDINLVSSSVEPIIFKAIRKEDNTIYFKSINDKERNPYSSSNDEYAFDTNGPGYFWLVSKNRD